jgi:hypothetical protein
VAKKNGGERRGQGGRGVAGGVTQRPLTHDHPGATFNSSVSATGPVLFFPGHSFP